jgi:uncharacterized protein
VKHVSGKETISVVIPTLNEELELPETLRRVGRVPEVVEVLVVDGGSRDQTIALAEASGARVVKAGGGRGGQLRSGAEQAVGDIVLMLHADTWVEPVAGRAAIQVLDRPGVVAGGFWKRFRDDVPWVMRGARLRCRLLLEMYGYIFGDQGFFLRRSMLAEIGGVPAVPLMEELEMCAQLRERGRLELADATVTTSWRKFQKLGILPTYLLMGQVLRAYRAGVPLDELRRRYQG